MPSIESTDELFLHNGQSYTLVGGQGVLLNPQSEFVRALYVKSTELGQMLRQSHGQLPLENVSLFCINKSDRDEMVGFLFIYKGKKQIMLDYGSTPWAVSYRAKHWDDLEPGPDSGFLITGPGLNSVWRIVRVEPDHLKRVKLTLKAVFPATGLPCLNFSRVKDTQLRARIESDWTRLQEHVGNKHGDEVVTASKNILEGIFTDLLDSLVQPSAGSLAQKLERLESLAKTEPNSAPVNRLGLHLAQKIRLLHQRTHPERAASLTTQMRPEFLLTSVEDLIEVLAMLGYVQGVR